MSVIYAGIVMFSPLSFFTTLLKWPLRVLVKFKIVPDNAVRELALDLNRPVFYVCHTESASDLATLRRVCQKLALPDPLTPVSLDGRQLSRTLFLVKPHSVIGGRSKTRALEQGQQLLQLHLANPQLDAQLVPVAILWGRAPGKENSIKWLLGEANAPHWLAKMLIVLVSGRHTLVRLSRAVSLNQMAAQFGDTADTARKLLRMSRFHFYRQKLAATGPKLVNRSELFNALLASPALKQAIEDEARSKKVPVKVARNEAHKLLQEIAADYRESTLRVGDRVLSWLWKKLYSGIKINNADMLHDLAQKGHEIVYVPCHRSHMDYLLLSYVIYHQGLVPPHIAAGINLNFWPAGTIFRRGGAFFIRRSFSGNKLYSAVFREYLSQLFSKGYAVKYYSEGGRSRTGRLLQPKTGMLAMTVQSMLRGIERPVTLVPVYLGYEHVMEVSTYVNELQGQGKKKESIGGVLKAIRHLRDYGFGYVNFGEPIQLNQYLNQQVSDWKKHINPLEVQKPNWLNPLVAKLANQVMQHINQAAALNATNLIALSVLATDKHIMTRDELSQQLDLYINLQRQVPYHPNVSLPEADADGLIKHALTLQKVNSSSDGFGELIGLSAEHSVLARYYRNNVLHLFMLPSLLACAVLHQRSISRQQLLGYIEQLYPLLQAELFLYVSSLQTYCQAILQFMTEQGLVESNGDNYYAPAQQSRYYYQLSLLAYNAEDTLQRYAIVLNLVQAQGPLSRPELEKRSHQLAQRLLNLHGIVAPEYYDKGLFTTLINALKEAGISHTDSHNQVCRSERLEKLTQTVNTLLRNDILQSLQSIMPQQAAS
ncbi:glycerol-3-phosphate 1-O-acyltransferase PlsB [Arsukibacterium sp.]|uniref:glycerol-3-phosphate 1-O-acyltransferase PlsB n=1 Tax=Arsukibacterium sp. TaxID=1977258 RepID=UPI00299CF8A6|nr:glycerol-3-phosphate 1-O-acyltransferase PlsB [Arsukibacterium sp.]MDX1676350.1 glycerol-3-phosphate 1-O-acyltransferase PlsB [Arsukibacterium sp.]